MDMEKRRRVMFFGVIMGAVALVLVPIAVWVISSIFAGINSAKIDLTVVPQSAEILVNGNKYGNGQYAVKPGEYHIEISKEGFATETRDLSLAAGDTGSVYLILQQTDGGDWFAEHDDDATAASAIIDYQGEKETNKIVKKYPIVDQLPLKFEYFDDKTGAYTWFVISHVVNDAGDGIILKITDYTGGNRENALNRLKTRGFDPDDYEIQYEDVSAEYTSWRAE